jgi:hypothetical protein
MGTPNQPGTTPSLPGAQSSRTDGPGSVASKQAIRYAAGERGAEDFVNLQGQAPMSKSMQMPQPSAAGIANTAAGQAQPQQSMQSSSPLAGLLDPNLNSPNPITHGNPLGAGAGLEALGLQPNQQFGGTTARQTVQASASKLDASPELQHLAAQLGQ